MSSGTMFETKFWGEGNHGFEVLLQNLKTGASASKELGEFIRERTVVEDGYVKGLTKMSKTISHVPESSMGAFSPVWKVLKDMCDQLTTIHTQFVKDLTDLAKEISDYNSTQRDKLKQNLRGEIEAAQDSLNMLQSTEVAVHRSKKQYEHSVEQLNKMVSKHEKARTDPSANQKTKLQLESRVKQAKTWMETMKGDHQTAVQKNCDQLMEFQGKMVEACRKFESLEEEHLAQMVTFMLKISRTQNSSHVQVEQLYSSVNSQMDLLSVEKLLKEFVEAKGTGNDKPTPFKFKPIEVSAPTGIPASVSTEDLRTPSPTTARSGSANKGESSKTFRGRFKKKKTKQASKSNGPVDTQQPPPENVPEVDEEGYSIRPQDAASFSQFPDDHSNQKQDSDSDSDYDEPENKIKKLTIRKIADIPQASVDDIKASVMSLKVGASSSGMRKATSSQSLNLLDTPPVTRRIPSTNSSNNLSDDSKGDSGSALIDLDDILLDSSALSQMPAPLLPTSSTASPLPLVPTAFDSNTVRHIDPTATLSPWTLPSPPSSSSKAAAAATSTDTSPPGPKPVPRPRTGSLKSNQQQSPQKQQLPPPTATTMIHPSDVFGPRNASEPAIKPLTSEAPRLPDKKRRTTSGPEIIVESQSQGSLSSITESTETITNSLSPSDITPTNSNSQQQTPTDGSGNIHPPAVSPVVSDGAYHVPIEVGDKENKTGDTSPKLAKNDTSLPILAPPLPAPRRGGTSRRKSANTSTGDLLAGGGAVSPLATTQMRSGSASPVIFGNGTVSNATTSLHHVPAQTPSLKAALPLAIAFQETCNAMFKGTDVTKCLIKIDGEMVMSFPADFIPRVSSHDLLSFRLEHLEDVVGLRHNQTLVKKESDEHLYKFDKEALLAHLTNMQERKSSPFYNIQILKYEVKVDSGKNLPLKLTSFWKCEPSVTNFRLDYSYNSSVFQQGASKPSLTNVSFTVPVSGGVRNALSKPTGNWSNENNTMRWKLGEIQPVEEPVSSSLHAKFDVTSGPSVPAPVVAQFLCNGATLSGLGFQLTTDAYKVSLVKNKCISGKYTAEINK